MARSPLLVELHRVGDRPRLADQVAGVGAAARTIVAPGAVDGLPGQRRVRLPRARRPAARAAAGRPGRSPPGCPAASSRHQVTSVRSPNVQTIAMPVPLAGSASGCACTGTSTPKSGRAHRARRPGRRTARRRGGRPAPRRPAAAPAGWCRSSTSRPSGPGTAAGGRRRAAPGPPARPARPRCAKPTSHSVGASAVVRLAAGQVAQERPLRGRPGPPAPIVVYGQRPVHRQPEPPPQRLERLLVLDGQPLAQLDEVAPGDRRRIARAASSTGVAGGCHAGSYGSDGSQRTP